MHTTPAFYRIFISILFVGLAHNLPVEAYVSKVATIAKVHGGVRGQTLATVFMYKARLEDQKCWRRARELRCTAAGGGKRGSAKQNVDKPLEKACDNKLQLQLLMQQAGAEAALRQGQRAEYFRRKGGGAIGNRVALARAEVKSTAVSVAKRIVETLAKTCWEGPKGGKRKAPPTAKECVLLLPKPGSVPAKHRGNPFKNVKLLRHGHAEIKKKRAAAKSKRKELSKSRPMNVRERIRAESQYDESFNPKRAAGKRKAGGVAGGDAAGEKRRATAAAPAAPPVARKPPKARLRVAALTDSEESGEEGASSASLLPSSKGKQKASQPPASKCRPSRVAADKARQAALAADRSSSDDGSSDDDDYVEVKLGHGEVGGAGSSREVGGAGSSSTGNDCGPQGSQNAEGYGSDMSDGSDGIDGSGVPEPLPSTSKPCTSLRLGSSDGEDGEASSGAQRHAAAQQCALQAARGEERAGGEPQGAPPPSADEQESAPSGEDPAKKYARLRRRVKLLEEQFRATHGRYWNWRDLSYKSEVFVDREARLRVKRLYQEYRALYDQYH